MPTKRVDVIVQKIIDIYDGNKEAFEPSVARVYYGDQALIDTFPAICVEGGTKTRTLSGQGATRKFALEVGVTIYIHHGQVQSSTITRAETDSLAEQAEDILHADITLDGLVIAGWVTRSDHGVALRANNVMLRTTRMVWEAQTREQF